MIWYWSWCSWSLRISEYTWISCGIGCIGFCVAATPAEAAE